MKYAIALVTAIFTILIMNFIDSRSAEERVGAATPPPTSTPLVEQRQPITADNAADLTLQRLFDNGTNRTTAFDVSEDIAIAQRNIVQISPLHDLLQLPDTYATLEDYTIMALRLMPSDDVRLAVDGDGVMYVGTAQQLRPLAAHDTEVTTASFNHNGSLLATGDVEGRVVIWDVATATLLTEIVASVQVPITALAFDADGTMLATGSTNHEVRLWRVEDGSMVTTLGNPTEAVVDLAFSPDGQTLAAASDAIWVWDIPSGDVVWQLPFRVQSVAFSPNGTVLATGGATMRLWDTTSGQLLIELDRAVTDIVFSSDGTAILTADEMGLVFHWGIDA